MLLTVLYCITQKNTMKKILPIEVMSYIHEYIDYKDIHKRKFKTVLNDMVLRHKKLSYDISTLTEFVIVMTSLLITALMPVYYITVMSGVKLNYYLYIFIVKCVFGFVIDYIIVMNVINYYEIS